MRKVGPSTYCEVVEQILNPFSYFDEIYVHPRKKNRSIVNNSSFFSWKKGTQKTQLLEGFVELHFKEWVKKPINEMKWTTKAENPTKQTLAPWTTKNGTKFL